MFSMRTLESFGDMKVSYIQGLDDLSELNSKNVEDRLLKLNAFNKFIEVVSNIFHCKITDSRSNLIHELKELCDENKNHINNMINTNLFNNIVNSRKAIYIMKSNGVEFHDREQLQYKNVDSIKFEIDEINKLVTFKFKLKLSKEDKVRLIYDILIEKKCIFDSYDGSEDEY